MEKIIDTVSKKLLQTAISGKKASEIKALLLEGADLECVNEWGLTPLMLASQYNHCVAVLKALLDAGADIQKEEPKYKSNALHLASTMSRNPKIISTLVEAGADLEKKNYLGETALIMSVAVNAETRITTQLIKLGANILATDYQGHTALDYAKAAKRPYLVNVLKGIESNL